MKNSLFPQRIICLTEEPTEILYLLGAQDRIIGISNYTVRPPQAPIEKKKVSYFVQANIKKIIALKPDLVIGFSDIQANIAKELIANGITVLINNHRSLADIFKVIVQIGSLVGKSDQAIQIVAEYRQNIENIVSDNTKYKIKPKIYFEEWFDPIISGICWVSEIIEKAGGLDIFSTNRKASLAKDRVIKDPNTIVNLNPDIILASWCGKKFQKDQMVKRKNWGSINAVKKNFIFEIPSSIILQPGPAAITDGVKTISDIISNWHSNRSNK